MVRTDLPAAIRALRTGGLALLFLLLAATSAQAQISVNIITAYNLIVDSNVQSPPTYAPNAGYIGANICNTSTTTAANNVFAYVGNYNGGVSPTPGTFPVWNSAAPSSPTPVAPVHLANTGNYSLKIEADDTGAADGTRYIGTLQPGECRIQYWLFSYPQCVNVLSGGSRVQDYPPCEVSITGGVGPEDDLTLAYDVWASGDSLTTVSSRRTFTMRNEISASANKIWPNNAAKVPDEYLTAIESVVGWGTLGPDGQPLTSSNPVYPGQKIITTQGIWYDLGNVGHGFDNNGDLVPDQNAWLQPVGDAATFDADCFRMINNYGLVIVKLKSGGELLIPFQNRLYFENLPENTGVVGLVYYQFMATDSGCSAAMTPYQEAASGFDNEKFSSDFGLSNGLLSGRFTIAFTKTDGSLSASTGNTLTYTGTATNNSGSQSGELRVNLGAPQLGTPLTIKEGIPAGTTYVLGSADDNPTTNLVEPSGTGTYDDGFTDGAGNLDVCAINYTITSSSFNVLYSTDTAGASWTAVEPAVASDVKWIRWVLDTTIAKDGSHDGTNCVAPNGVYDDGTERNSLPAGKSFSVTFQVTVNPTGGPVVCNTAYADFFAVSSNTAADCTIITGNNSLSGTVFKDDGSGGGTHGNYTQDGTETGIGAGVVVTLYYDLDGDGLRDSTDPQYATTTTAANGTYSFTNLADGPYLVIAKKYDGATSDGINNAATDSGFGTTGWGNTTFDPNLPLTTDQGILKLNEDLTTALLAVNIDLDKNNAVAQSVTAVNFAFAPPLRLTKAIVGNPDADANDVADTTIDEGDTFTYSITLENRLPAVGKQGPTGCQYTAWATTGTNGSPAQKEFTNPSNAWDGPNGTTATAVVTGGGLRNITGTTHRLAAQAGNITKVEVLYFGYFSVALTDDTLDLQLTRAGTTITNTMSTALIDSYVGAPVGFDPDDAISWDVTTTRPGGGVWAWADFPSLVSYINPSKASSADQKTFFLDAMGIRVTTDVDCEAGASTTLNPVPLQDSYDTGSFSYVSANPVPTSVNTATGIIQWDNVGPLLPGSSKTVTVTVKALNISGTRTGTCSGGSNPPATNSACNGARTDYGVKNVYYADGRQANDANDHIAVVLQGKGEIRGFVWKDTNADGWAYDTGEPYLQNVSVTLFACVSSISSTGAFVLETNSTNKTCVNATNGNLGWLAISTATTDINGAYEFIGLDNGFYMVEVGNTNSAPGSGSTSPFGGTQTAEPNDSQATSGGNATGTAGVCSGGCNNTWGWGASEPNTNALNLLNSPSAEEIIGGVNFGYNIPSAYLYGNIWRDVNGNATVNAGDTGLSGFTVQLYDDVNTNGTFDSGTDTLVATTTSDSVGNYAFSGLGADTYVVVVTPPTLLNKVWTETAESSTITVTTTSASTTVTSAGLFSASDVGRSITGTGIPAGATITAFTDANTVTISAAATATGSTFANIYRTASLNNQTPVTVTAGSISGSHDFGYTQTDGSTIGDTLYYDFDSDGIQDTGEAGIPNVTVQLYRDVDRDGTIDDGVDTVYATTSTNSSGIYLFSSLPAGSYVVKVDTADADFPTSVTATADPDLVSGRIGDFVWLDSDGDGVQDAGEDGLNGVVVNLYADVNGNGTYNAGTDAVVLSTITNVNGAYLFTGLNAGTYFVDTDTSTLPSTALARTTPGSVPTTITLATGSASNLTADFGYSPATNFSIGNRLWHDVDNDGVQDAGEVGIPFIDIVVTNGTGTGCASPGCRVTTDEAGYWIVTGLTAGTFTVDVQTTDTDFPRDFTVSTGTTDPRTVTVSTADLTNVDFGYRFTGSGSSPTGTISGRIFQDADGDATFDAGEARVSATHGNLVNLLDGNNNIIASTTTAADGTYSFTGVFIGTYTIESVDPLGTRYSTIFLSAAATFPNLNVMYQTTIETTPDNQSSVSVDGVHANLLQDFGWRRFLGSIGDTVYWDTNENGDQDFGEDGISGVTVRLFRAVWTDTNGDGIHQNGETSDTLVATATTTADNPLTGADEGGKYLFSNLASLATQRTVSVSTTNGSTTVTSSAGFLSSDVGSPISGTGIPAGATITAFNSTSSVTISAAATASGSGVSATVGGYYHVVVDQSTIGSQRSIGVSTTNGSTTVTSSGAFLATDLGRSIVGAGIPPGSYITAFTNASTVTISRAATATGSPTVSVAASRLIGDPDTDGTPCTVIPHPDIANDDYPPATVCDNEKLVLGFLPGNNYLGADWGYVLAGSGFASIGDYVWVDTDNDGIRDTGEQGIDRITVWLDTDNDGVVDAGEPTTETDVNGYYSFTGLSDATYNVRVLTSDTDWPAGLSTTPSYEVRSGNTDRNSHAQAVVTGGVVTSIVDGDAGTTDTCTAGAPFSATITLNSTTITSASFASGDVGKTITGVGIPAGTKIIAVTAGVSATMSAAAIGSMTTTATLFTCTNLDFDFGYRYTGTVTLSGTICVDNMRSFTASTTSGSATVTTTSPQFTAADVGARIFGTGISDGATITAFTSTTQVTISANATATGTPTVRVGDGFCGDNATDYSGVTTGESALEGVTVSAYLWTDTDADNTAWNASTGVLDAGDTFTFLTSVATAASGDYSFSGLPDGKVVLVFSVQDTQNLRMTTTNTNSSAEDSGIKQQLYEGTTTYLGNTVTIIGRQALNLAADANDAAVDVDYAFDNTAGGNVLWDFGDLPSAYAITLLSASGAQARVTSGTSIRLGATITTESDGRESSDASTNGDTGDDGVTLVTSTFGYGEINASITINASAAGWIAGWMDFNNDGDFNDTNERILNQAVVAGNNSLTFFVPSVSRYQLDYFARFRIYPSQPGFVSSSGQALDENFQPMFGEVEDYMFTTESAPTAVQMTTTDAVQSNKTVTITWKTATEVDNVGFHVYRQVSGGTKERLNKNIIPGSAFMTGRRADSARGYRFKDTNAPAGFVQYWIEDIDFDGTRTTHGPITPRLVTDSGVTEKTTDPDPTIGTNGGIFTTAAGMGVVAPAPAAPTQAQLDEQWKLAAVPAVKVIVTQPGWVRVTRAQLAAAGFDPGTNANKIAVFSDGIELPVVVNAKNATKFDSADSVEFFATGIDLPSTGGRVYYITVSKGSGSRMKSTGARGNSGAPTGSFPYTFSRAERSIYVAALKTERSKWFGQIVSTWPITQGLTVSNLQALGNAQLQIAIQGGTDYLEHVVSVNVNGTDIGLLRFYGQERKVETLPLATSLLVAGENTLTLTAVNGDEDLSVLESVSLTYPHLFRADDNALMFQVGGGSSVAINGFTSDQIRVADVTDPANVTLINASVGNATDGSKQVSFTTGGSGQRTIFAFAESRVLPPAQVYYNEPSTWNAATNAANLVIITNKAFLAAANTLKAARQAQGITTAVVDVQNLYDEFSFGHHGPHAIREFLRRTRSWKTVPKYAILFGDASFDPRNFYGMGSFDYVPTQLVNTSYLETASDDWFGDFDTTLAIGRIPARTAEDAAAMVAKLTSRNVATSDGWVKTVDLIADSDPAIDFSRYLTTVASVVPGSFTVNRISLATSPGSAITDAFNRGSLMLNYMGHGSNQMWGTGIFTSDTAASLSNGKRLPFVMSMNCLNGFFHDTWGDSLAEALLRNPNGGAIGVIALSVLSPVGPQAAVTVEFNRQVFGSTSITLGEAFLRAKQATTSPDVRRSLILFGDPTMKLR